MGRSVSKIRKACHCGYHSWAFVEGTEAQLQLKNWAQTIFGVPWSQPTDQQKINLEAPKMKTLDVSGAKYGGRPQSRAVLRRLRLMLCA